MTKADHTDYQSCPEPPPEIGELVRDIISKIADKWTMLILECLEEQGTLRFGEIAKSIPAVSQKMLTKTLRQMECDGLVSRKVHPVIPPRVDYALTPIGQSLSAAFCGVWLWAMDNQASVQQARDAFAKTQTA
jgi:DNA-binding HxlR family transcriptional regulator